VGADPDVINVANGLYSDGFRARPRLRAIIEGHLKRDAAE